MTPTALFQPSTDSLPRRSVAARALAGLAAGLACALPLPVMAQAATGAASAPAAKPAKAALTVSVVSPVSAALPNVLAANGNIAPWQEASVGSESNGLRLAEVRVEVGDRVQRGQVLARFDAAATRAELAQLQAGLAEAQANEADAVSQGDRTRALRETGALSAQQIQQALSAEAAAKARVAAQRAAIDLAQLRLTHAEVLAPDAGVISARNATVGAVSNAGQELFRLIRGSRLEWRAEVPSAELVRIQVGQAARLSTPSGRAVTGTVRKIAPTVDAQTRNGLVYVDLKPSADSDARAGMYARGEFRFDSRAALTLPASAVLLRDGYSVVMRLEAGSRVRQIKVNVLGRDADRLAVDGLAADAQVVTRGAAFLSDGDTVRVVAP